MKILAISGSARKNSTNTALLRVLAEASPRDAAICVFDSIASLPVFSPDVAIGKIPQAVADFSLQIRRSDGVVISCPEYVRAIPGGLKNAIDWLVGHDEIVGKPIALVHASHRGDDMLQSLRIVLGTVSSRFDDSHFLRFPLVAKSPDEIRRFLWQDENISQIRTFIDDFRTFIESASMSA